MAKSVQLFLRCSITDTHLPASEHRACQELREWLRHCSALMLSPPSVPPFLASCWQKMNPNFSPTPYIIKKKHTQQKQIRNTNSCSILKTRCRASENRPTLLIDFHPRECFCHLYAEPSRAQTHGRLKPRHQITGEEAFSVNRHLAQNEVSVIVPSVLATSVHLLWTRGHEWLWVTASTGAMETVIMKIRNL